MSVCSQSGLHDDERGATGTGITIRACSIDLNFSSGKVMISALRARSEISVKQLRKLKASKFSSRDCLPPKRMPAALLAPNSIGNALEYRSHQRVIIEVSLQRKWTASLSKLGIEGFIIHLHRATQARALRPTVAGVVFGVFRVGPFLCD